jgi:TonB family protein
MIGHRVIARGCTLLVVVLLVAPVGAEQPSLARARELYTAASYADALATLDALQATAQPGEREPIALYRVLCLVALGRTGEANAAIETLVHAHPLYRPPTDDLSPRIRTALLEARTRMLPAIIQQRYAEAKAAFDRKDFAPAATTFKWVLQAVQDPDIAQAVAKPPLSDLRTLAAGFQDLSEKALAPPPPPPVVAAPPPPPPRDYKRLFTQADAGVAPPVAINQALPPFPGRPTAVRRGVLEVTIAANGTVESARMVTPVHPQYDAIVVNAAKRWQYEPARVDGVRVRYTKSVQINVAPAP